MASEVGVVRERSSNPVNAMARKDYQAGRMDRRFGIYDKWYRYNHRDEGKAYDEGWQSVKRKDKWNKLTILNG